MGVDPQFVPLLTHSFAALPTRRGPALATIDSVTERLYITLVRHVRYAQTSTLSACDGPALQYPASLIHETRRAERRAHQRTARVPTPPAKSPSNYSSGAGMSSLLSTHAAADRTGLARQTLAKLRSIGRAAPHAPSVIVNVTIVMGVSVHVELRCLRRGPDGRSRARQIGLGPQGQPALVPAIVRRRSPRPRRGVFHRSRGGICSCPHRTVPTP